MIFQKQTQKFRGWWRSPVSIKDRILGAFVGGLGGFWIGALGPIMLGAMPVSFGEMAAWALAMAICCAVAGLLFPKPVIVVLFPFAIFGIWG